MSAPYVLLHTIGQALLDTLDVSVMSDVVVEATPEFAESIWRSWDARADYEQKCRELQALTRLSEDEVEDAADAIVQAMGLAPRGEQTEGIFAYLRLVPAAVRRQCRRPANPLGTSLPAGMPLYGSWDLLPLLPPRMPKFQPGDRPGDVGDWELRELIELSACGEAWKAVNPRLHNRPPVVLHFVTDATAKRCLRKNVAPLLDRILQQGRVPGVVPLQEMHLFAEPPCVQYAYFQAADLASLVRQARETETRVDLFEVADLVRQLAQTLGRLHAAAPAIVHGSLDGSAVLLMNDGSGRRRCLLANLGLGALCAPSGLADGAASPYISPERARGAAARPADDVYALGVLWYQLLEGDLGRPRPGGSSWRRRLVARGMPAPLVELLESCFDDEPAARPADGAALATAIDGCLAACVAAEAGPSAQEVFFAKVDKTC